MLRLKIVVVDKTRSPFLREGEAFYLERLRRYARTEWEEVKPVRLKKGRSEEEAVKEEGRLLLRRLSRDDHPIALDREGGQYDSVGFSRLLEHLASRPAGFVSILIGGPLGLSREVVEGSALVLSLSRMTLTHEMSRLVL
ncbi:MAG: 23S rRNA (pseudouridine(1915)-N(3))-methyltransferase RlmH, partial [Desulfobacteraceae bacterium]